MDHRLFFSATARNREVIGEVLFRTLPSSGTVLEIASGSGEHAFFFQRLVPYLQWQASDPTPIHRKSIKAWIEHEGMEACMPNPIDLDVEKQPWPLTSNITSTLVSIVCINLVHISPWSCSKALFKASGNYLQDGQYLILYGPFKRNGIHTSESNVLFDQSLRDMNVNWGVRDLNDLNKLAIKYGFKNGDEIEMPANNLLIKYLKSSKFDSI